MKTIFPNSKEKLFRHISAAAVLVAALLFTSCRKEESSSYDVIPKSQKYSCNGETRKIKVLSDSDWTLSSTGDWATLSPASGSGSMEVKVTVAPNPTDKDRECALNLVGAGGTVMASVHITQAFKTEDIDNIIIAHRGAYKEYGYPDNSVAALSKAIEIGVYGSECDINITSDNQVIVVHGEKFGGLPILNNSYSTLRNNAKLKNGENLPLLSDFLTLIMAGNGTKLILDIKSLSDAAGGNAQSIRAGTAAAKLIKKMGAQDRVMFIVGRLDVFNGIIKEVDGEWPVGYMNCDLTPEQFKKNTKGLTDWANFSITNFGKNPATGKFDAAYLDRQIESWNKAGIEVSLYNIDTEEQIQWYLPHKETLKACSNYPMLLLKRVGKR